MATAKRFLNGVCGHLTPKDYGQLLTGVATPKKRSLGLIGGFNRKSHGTKPKRKKK